MGTTEYTGYAWSTDADGVVTVTMDDPDNAVNIMNPHFVGALQATVERLEAERDTITGVVLTSAKRSWFAGGDLELLRTADHARAAEQTAHVEHVKSLLRRIETLGRPVVAAMHGTALGGGLEIALACHRRIAASDVPGARFGLPEVSLGLLPGGGGVTRTVRMLGLQRALQEVILPATRFRPEDALAVGIVDELAPLADLDARARAWIAANPTPVKPWDGKGFRIPGGGPDSPSVAAMLPALPAMLRRQLHGAPMPAPRAALAAAVEGAYVDFDTASRIETRYFVSLIHTRAAKNMISAFFFDQQRIDAGGSRPDGVPVSRARALTAGTDATARAIATAAAKAGIDVTRRDAADDEAVEVSFEGASEVLRIALLADGAPLPSGGVGIHLPAPADRTQVVEVVRDEHTADDALARTVDLVRQLRKTPIVVSHTPFTTRLVAARVAEAVAAVGEGVEPASVEQAALQAGYPLGALQLLDELTLPRARALRRAARAAAEGAGRAWAPHPADEVLDWMVEDADRPGRAAGRGFFDYDGSGERTRIWPGLRERFGGGAAAVPFADLQERMLFAEALAAIDVLEQGGIASVAEANIGSIHGAGFPAWTGGAVRYVHRREGGAAGFVARTRELAAAYGERFAPPASLITHVERGEPSV